MPKIPKKETKVTTKNESVSLREIADRLIKIEALALKLREEAITIWEILYTRGLTELGPLDKEDELPF